MKLVNIEGRSGLVRDMETNVIHNINTDEVVQARLRKKIKREKKREMEILKNEVSSFKTELSDVKQLLTQILEKL